MSLDELRRMAQDADDDPFEDWEEYSVQRGEVEEELIFGLNPVERMFLAIGLFLVVSILSFLILLVTESIVI
jgi:hypothetical protein